jgi:hypothetical protein
MRREPPSPTRPVTTFLGVLATTLATLVPPPLAAGAGDQRIAVDELEVERSYDATTRRFRSTAEPALELTLPDSYTYLGRLELTLEEAARVDRHLFAELDGGRLRSLVVLQFEHLLEGAEGSYHFTIPSGAGAAGSNYRFSPERIELGRSGYVHNTWAFDWRADAAANPDKEGGRTLRLLEERGLGVDAGWIMSRFVREVGPERRAELILFYMEPLDRRGHSLEELPDGGPATSRYDSLSAAVTSASLEVFGALRD